MRLCLDFGNTKVKAAVFDKNNLQIFFSKSDDISFTEINELIENYSVNAAIISSTRLLNDGFLKDLQSKLRLIILDEHTKLPITNKYLTPHTLGKDRLAAAVGARHYFPDQACIIIDAGTCITMDFVTASGEYLGGNISPGIYMRRQSMHDYTDKLPLAEVAFPSDFLGYDTQSALQNGFLQGTIFEVDSFIRSIHQKYGPCQIIITGGDVKYFEDRLNFQIFASSNLVLVGLNEILTINE